VTETACPPPLAGLRANDQDAFRRATIDRVAPAADATCALWIDCARSLAHRSRLGGAATCVSTPCGELLDQRRVRPRCLAVPRSSRRAMRRTDFCLLTFLVRAPTPRRFPLRQDAFASRARGDDRLIHVSAIRFGGPHVAAVVGVLFPPRRVRSEPLTSLSPPSRGPRCSRSAIPRQGRLDRPQLARVTDAGRKTIRNAFHRASSLAPQRSLERPAPDFPGVTAWPPRSRLSPPRSPPPDPLRDAAGG